MAVERMLWLTARGEPTQLDAFIRRGLVGRIQVELAVEHLPKGQIGASPIPGENGDFLEIYRHVALQNNRFFLVGWMPESEAATVLSVARELDVQVELTAPNAAISPPTKLHNHAFFRPYESIVAMYGLPSYGGIDPTPMVAVVYTLLFGIMVADLGQGLCLAALGWLLWRKKRLPLGGILLRCGFTSVLFGFVFGTVFGHEHLLDAFYARVLGIEKPITVMEDVTRILVIALGMGAALITLSMSLHVWDRCKQGHWGQGIFSENGVAGILTYFALVGLVLKFFVADAVHFLPMGILLVMLALGVVLLFFKENLVALTEKAEGNGHPRWRDNLLARVFELLECLLNYFSNTVSFLRVGAFVLVHAGMMLVVYSLAPAQGAGRYLVLLLGNLLVLGVEGVLTYIQALRLVFYEMFSRFYHGEGRPFCAITLSEQNRE